MSSALVGVLKNFRLVPDDVTVPSSPAVITPLNQLDAIVRFDLPLIDTTRWMRLLAAGESQAGAAERERVTRDLVRKQVVASYFGYAAALALLESAKKSFAVAEAQLKLTGIRQQAGTVTELELLRARAETLRNKQLIVDATSLVATTRRTLRTLSGVEPPDDVPLPLADLRAEPGFEELEQGVGALPAVRAAEHDAQAAGKLATASKLALVPVIGAQFTERITNATGFAGQAALFNTGVTASWRLDGPTLTGIATQAHGESIALLAVERARLVARDQIHADWQRFNGALQKVESAEGQVLAAARAAQVARDRYAAGAATQVDVIQSERDLFGAEFGQIQARTDLATARLSLRLSAGRPLDGK
jgi:outer membrane protein TolC